MLFEDGFKFSLIEELKEVDTKGWILIASAAVLIAVITIYLLRRPKNQPTVNVNTKKPSATIILVHGALCIAMSFVLSYFKLFSMPTGGSITLASMLPLMVYANRYGVKFGIMAGAVYGLLQYVQSPQMFHWIQLLVDYPIAFGLIGLGGLTKGDNNLVFSVLIGGTARFLAHLFTGIVFFGTYIMIGEGAETAMSFGEMLSTNFGVSFIYNAPYMFADIAICAVIALLPPFRSAIRKALKY